MARLLLVEDNEKMCTLYRSELQSEGYEVMVEHDGKAGMERALQDHPDLVVMDISLPQNMDGLESMSRILGQDRRIPVIIHTAYEQYKDNFMSWAAEKYVVKSGDLRPLKKAISQVLDMQANPENTAGRDAGQQHEDSRRMA